MTTTKLSKNTSNGLPLLGDTMYWHLKFLSTLANLLTRLKFWPFYSCPVAEPEKNQQCFNILKEKENHVHDDQTSGLMISMAEVKIVVGKMGILFDEGDLDGAGVGGIVEVGADEFRELFEVEEPSFKEIREAFDVFDQNRDGFIDAVELKRVLCCLGFEELGCGSIEHCGKMIRKFDENGDGVLDFNEFLKCMEKCLC
ncbi:hypothetical protein Ancab_018809 [Ancistrocladus abbreviatus]